MRKLVLLILLDSLLLLPLFSQNYTISGYVEDSLSGERLIGANIFESNTLKGTVSNNYGFFSLTLPKGKIDLVCSYVGYAPFRENFDLKEDITLNIQINSSAELEEVIVLANSPDHKVKSTEISQIEIPVRDFKALPVLMGEVDIIKTLQLLPGVQSGTEGKSGFYVRGGGPDQNLILLDGVPVYNVYHLFGFFSVFNSNAIKNVKLIKGGFPARYGGRLSSVLDIRMKEGNMREYHGKASIGLIASNLYFEGPIIKDKTSFVVTGRRTYLDILVKPIIRAIPETKGVNLGYYFYDLNAKVSHKFSEKSKIYLSTYNGTDKLYYKDDYESIHDDYLIGEHIDLGIKWGNQIAVARWNYQISNKLFSNSTLTYSKFNYNKWETFMLSIGYQGKEQRNIFNHEVLSGIQDWSSNIDFDFIPNPNHYIKFGGKYTYHTFSPGISVLQNLIEGDRIESLEGEEEAEVEQLDTTFGNKPIYAQEFNLYVEDDFQLSGRIKMNLGVHASGFLVDEKFYNSIEPRLALRFLINDKLSIKGAYSLMSQYIQLLTDSNIGLPSDLWLPATKTILPMSSTQYAVGIFYNHKDELEISIEGFYKDMLNPIEYKDGKGISDITDEWVDKIEKGKAWAYGVELFVRRNVGKLTGWAGYTWSYSMRKFENISFGKPFPFKYDRRHDISLALSYEFNDKTDVGLTWIFGTGYPVTLAQEKYPSYFIYPTILPDYYYPFYPDDSNIDNIEHRNNYRMPNYHRLDIGFNRHFKFKVGELTINTSIYNAYFHLNPLFVTKGYDRKGNKKFFVVGIFPIIPSVGLSYEF